MSNMLGSRQGRAPGTIFYTGEKRHDAVHINLFSYEIKHLEERTLESIQGITDFTNRFENSWVNFDGVHDTSIIEAVGRRFSIHSLTLEDITQLGQRPKLEEYDDYLFLILKMWRWDDKNNLSKEQVSFVLTEKVLLTFQEKPGDVFDPVRERLRQEGARVRTLGIDYLAHVLMDAIIDHYFTVLEKMNAQIEALEKEIMNRPSPETLQKIYQYKKTIISMRKSIWPTRDIIHQILQEESSVISSEARPFFRNLYDHAARAMDAVESFRDNLSGLTDLYLSNVSNRMNEVMKVLTIIATIFIPPTFVAGIYGMNFEFMPELQAKWGYPMIIGIFVISITSMLIYFKRKRWI